ncbi:hypothetical protein ABZ816_07680 [Actinosynnema sp. NPDC047251]|uniref:Putative secreted protein n=1 Tax=Saccharothrix espanaensis (strain ATCC 51144 / DSM 44229 / JCM 9112 / NBRC 15066 / NRRL 15764) TaxID=1179773 RepID=K0JQ55_SACES|nr:hypothetical protein [Saccharothrix espanaensis]CCH27661.1 putative secreted protein [Saccharothrix espanaensis DSM 44229]
MKLRLTVAGVLAAVLVTGACSGSGSGSAGSSSTTSAAATTTTKPAADPVTWAGTYCEGITPALEGVVELLQIMLGGAASDPAAMKAKIQEFAGKSGQAFTDAGQKLDDLGAPSPESQALHDELVKFFTESAATWTKAGEEVAKLDPADPEFATKLGALGGDETTTAGDQIKKLQNDPKLGEAFKKAPECTALTEKLKSLGG